MMEVKLGHNDGFRVDGGYGDLKNFIDIKKDDFATLATTLFAGFQYIEIRKMDDLLRVYTFPKKSIKKDFDFGAWKDAEVIYSLNQQIMHK